MFALFFMIAFVTGLQNPMGIIVKEQFQVPNWMSQLGNFANFIAYACMGIPAGIMLQRIGYKKTALTAIVVGFEEEGDLRKIHAAPFGEGLQRIEDGAACMGGKRIERYAPRGVGDDGSCRQGQRRGFQLYT